MPEKIGQSFTRNEGSLRLSTRVLTGNTTLDTNDAIIFVSGSSVTLTLPRVAPSAGVVTAPSGLIYIIINTDESNAVTIAANGADTITGGASLSLAADTAVLITNDGVSDWEPLLGAAT